MVLRDILVISRCLLLFLLILNNSVFLVLLLLLLYLLLLCCIVDGVVLTVGYVEVVGCCVVGILIRDLRLSGIIFRGVF